MLGLEALGSALGLSAGRVATAMAGSLREAVGGEPGVVVAVGADLGRALARAGFEVIVIATGPRPARRRKKDPPSVRAQLEALPFESASVDGVFAAGDVLGAAEAGSGATGAGASVLASIRLLIELGRIVRPGGVVGIAAPATGLVRKVAPPEDIASRFLHAALVGVEQRPVGSFVLTSARVGAVRARLATANATRQAAPTALAFLERSQ